MIPRLWDLAGRTGPRPIFVSGLPTYGFRRRSTSMARRWSAALRPSASVGAGSRTISSPPDWHAARDQGFEDRIVSPAAGRGRSSVSRPERANNSPTKIQGLCRLHRITISSYLPLMRAIEGSISHKYRKLGSRERSSPGNIDGDDFVLQRNVRRGGVGGQGAVAVAMVEDDFRVIEARPCCVARCTASSR